MHELNLPRYEIRLSDDRSAIFDAIRKKFVELTPEEWVRQHFINYMINHLGYPSGLIKVEFGIKYNNLRKRPDILAFDRQGKPLLLVECKSFDVKISKNVFDQVSLYNKVLKSPYAVVTNGLQHFCWRQNMSSGKSDFLEAIPHFESLLDQASNSSEST